MIFIMFSYYDWFSILGYFWSDSWVLSIYINNIFVNILFSSNTSEHDSLVCTKCRWNLCHNCCTSQEVIFRCAGMRGEYPWPEGIKLLPKIEVQDMPEHTCSFIRMAHQNFFQRSKHECHGCHKYHESYPKCKSHAVICKDCNLSYCYECS